MPQQFHAVKCFNCGMFQVHIVKKAPKWECKVCGSKQSLLTQYGVGTAAECRAHVQKLNEMRSVATGDVTGNDTINTTVVTTQSGDGGVTSSKWSKYLDDEDCANTE